MLEEAATVEVEVDTDAIRRLIACIDAGFQVRLANITDVSGVSSDSTYNDVTVSSWISICSTICRRAL